MGWAKVAGKIAGGSTENTLKPRSDHVTCKYQKHGGQERNVVSLGRKFYIILKS